MKTRFEIVALTKREQRFIIIIVMVLLGAAIAKHYRDAPSVLKSPALTRDHPTAATLPEDERAPPDDTR